MSKYKIHPYRYFLILAVLSTGSATGLNAQIPVQILEQQIPVYRWTVNAPQGDTSEYFMPDKDRITDYCLRFVGIDSSRLIFKDLQEHQDVLDYQTSGRIRKEKKFKKLDSVLYPDLYGVFLYSQDGKYGLITEDGTGIAAPVYDQIIFLYQYVSAVKEWVISPMSIVYKNKQYALMDAGGFVVTRFCKTVEELSSAYMLNEANEFKIDQTVTPQSLWGY